MRFLLRLLSPLIGLVAAATGMLLALTVVAAWLGPDTLPPELVTAWEQGYPVLRRTTWTQSPVPGIALAAAAAGLLLVLIGLSARRSDVPLESPAPGITVATSPRTLARFVGRRVRVADDIATAAVTASRHKVSVTAQVWGAVTPETRSRLHARVEDLLGELPLRTRPQVAVRARERTGPR